MLFKQWDYGFILNDDGSKRHVARRHKSSGVVQFVLWPKGHSKGYKGKRFWHRMGAGWEKRFVKSGRFDGVYCA